MTFHWRVFTIILLIGVISCSDCKVINKNGTQLNIRSLEPDIEVMNRFNNKSFCCSCNKQCISKCCPYGTVLSANKTCVNESGSLFYNDIKDNHVIVSEVNKYLLIEGFPKCVNSRFILHVEKDPFKINHMGDLVEQMDNTKFDIINYCLDYFEPDNHTISVVCFSQSAGQTYMFFPIGMLTSTVFLAATFIVYAIIPELRNVHGLCLMCHVTSLGIGYFLLSITTYNITPVENLFCLPLAYGVMFSFQASFFWLNAMCFDIWWGLRKMTATIGEASKNIHKKKFIFYSIYSWGLPLIIIFLVFLIEHDVIPQLVVKPDFGVQGCWFNTEEAALYYLYLPLTFNLVSNLVFFILTIRIVFKQLRETDKVLKKDENKRHQESERKRVILYTKLFIVMGINWITELLSFLLNYWKITNLNTWKVTDLSNTLQGVLIFFIFVWKRRVLHLLTAKFCPKVVLKTNNNRSINKKISTDTNSIQQTTITSISSNVEMGIRTNGFIKKSL